MSRQVCYIGEMACAPLKVIYLLKIDETFSFELFHRHPIVKIDSNLLMKISPGVCTDSKPHRFLVLIYVTLFLKKSLSCQLQRKLVLQPHQHDFLKKYSFKIRDLQLNFL